MIRGPYVHTVHDHAFYVGMCFMVSTWLEFAVSAGLVSQRKFSSKISELGTNVRGQSCQHVHNIGSKSSSRVGAVVTVRKRVSIRVKTFGCETLWFLRSCGFWGRRSRVFVSAGPRVGASICESSVQRAHRTVARAGFAFQKEHFGKMRLAKCAPDCSERTNSERNKRK